MGIKLTAITEKTRQSSIQWDDEEVAFSYFPNYLTPELEERMESEDSDFVAEMVSPCLEWWDVLDADGKRLPTDPPTLKQVPSAFILAIWKKITEEQNPPEESS
jgi:hypothetical protein